MTLLDDHRCVSSSDLEYFQLESPFSSFDFVEKRFGETNSIRRLFSLARSFSCQTLIVETIPVAGIITEENEDILARYPDHRNDGLLRLSFWNVELSAKAHPHLNQENLVGYAILKFDSVPSRSIAQWHVFEAVFVKYAHEHNCVPRAGQYRLVVGSTSLIITGILYCQQNGLNKACAQVALRSLISRCLLEGDISYRRINKLAEQVNPAFEPAQGLSVPQIRAILAGLGIEYSDIDYSQDQNDRRRELPYQKYAYAGLESGCGALVGFRLTGQELQYEAKHIIPFYGHTFNKDTWVPDAEISYFRIGETAGYVPSESWTSSFIGHDDNFGPNFCIPRLYIEHDKVDYVVELFRPGIRYSGVKAEAIALDILYSALSTLSKGNKWINRLIQWAMKQQIVFRAQAASVTEYTDHLQSLTDWEGEREDQALPLALAKVMPSYVWAVEISTPQLFPANERKLGEIVLDATRQPELQEISDFFNIFLFARLPGIYLLGGDVINETPSFTQIPSKINSHTELFKF
ncbi:hypothetical protein [Desulfurivibrio alkaliphilus]|uniref:Uncharacterized protein n=1 Tax=Desulfurivibrio alkaliphilus (strain DSM 19089 / UNIQEM U267 / AHT2) TaxID=589865 RepID=D6Z4N4_DESAT|nr:hypothetical protein [Desulfurivibrio alkaliphilus]ADH86509.1 hypothetical protein DaAHT2_1827 [Desulfurivibrio alkaliphilus AHT 2]